MLNDEQQRAHFLSNLSYKNPKERQQFLQNSKYKNDLFIDGDNNHDNFVSVHSTKDNKVYNAHRGTSNAQDVLTDAYLAGGQLHSSDRYKRSSELSKNVYNRFGGSKDIVEVGHSLGGTLADQISREHGGRSVAFNMGATPLASYGKDVSDQHQHIRTDNDPVSHFSSGATQTVEHKDAGFEQKIAPVTQGFTNATGLTGSSGLGLAWKAGLSLASAFKGHGLDNFDGH